MFRNLTIQFKVTMEFQNDTDIQNSWHKHWLVISCKILKTTLFHYFVLGCSTPLKVPSVCLQCQFSVLVITCGKRCTHIVLVYRHAQLTWHRLKMSAEVRWTWKCLRTRTAWSRAFSEQSRVRQRPSPTCERNYTHIHTKSLHRFFGKQTGALY